MTVIERRAARVLLVDRAGRTLLLHGGDPARPGLRWWFTPGGGLDGDETHAQGAARELAEETGLRVDPAELGEPVWHQVAEFSYRDRRYRQDQQFFLLRVDEWRVDTAGMDDDEQQTITEHRWWSPAEIDASDEQIFPAELAGLLRSLSPSSAVGQEGFGGSVSPAVGREGFGGSVPPPLGREVVDGSAGGLGVGVDGRSGVVEAGR